MERQISVSVDVFAAIWAARLPSESSEDQILGRVLKIRRPQDLPASSTSPTNDHSETAKTKSISSPPNGKWTDVLAWALEHLGGCAPLTEIYAKSREGRRALNMVITREHDASARECLESHCSDSKKYREKADLFWMPYGKGAGIWALRSWNRK